MACSSRQLGAGATIPIDGLPIGVSFSTEEQRCDGSQNDRREDYSFVQQYISTNAALIIAECGYRMCMLRRNNGDPTTLAMLANVCGGVPSTSGVGLGESALSIPWSRSKAGKSTPITLPVKGSADVDLRYDITFPGDTKAVWLDKKAGNPKVLRRSTTTQVALLAKVPTKAPLRGEPLYYPFSLRAANRQSSGNIMVYSPTDDWPHCTEWHDDRCVRCEFPLQMSGGGGTSEELTCSEMTPGANVEVVANGVVIDQGHARDWDTWLEFALSAGKASVAWNNVVGTPNSACPCSGRRGVRELRMVIRTQVQPDGRLPLTLLMKRCTGAEGGASCAFEDGAKIVVSKQH